MIRFIEIKDDVIATSAEDKLTTEDYKKILPRIKELLESHDKLSWYFEMKDFEGWEPAAIWKDLKFDVEHLNDFKKIAMVGDKKWQEIMTELVKPFTESDVEFFDFKDREKAMNWVKN